MNFELVEKEKGIIIFEVRSDSKIKESYGPYRLYKEKKYGDKLLTFLTKA